MAFQRKKPAATAANGAAGTAVASTLLAMVCLASTASSHAAADPARPCIVGATEALPKISGLEIKKSRTRPMSAEQLANWDGQSKPIIVDIDTVASGIFEQYSFICATEKNGQAYVRRVVK
jgi:hypothetical protein